MRKVKILGDIWEWEETRSRYQLKRYYNNPGEKLKKKKDSTFTKTREEKLDSSNR